MALGILGLWVGPSRATAQTSFRFVAWGGSRGVSSSVDTAVLSNVSNPWPDMGHQRTTRYSVLQPHCGDQQAPQHQREHQRAWARPGLRPYWLVAHRGPNLHWLRHAGLSARNDFQRSAKYLGRGERCLSACFPNLCDSQVREPDQKGAKL